MKSLFLLFVLTGFIQSTYAKEKLNLTVDGQAIKFSCQAQVIAGPKHNGTACALKHTTTNEIFAKKAHNPGDECRCEGDFKQSDLSDYGKKLYTRVKERLAKEAKEAEEEKRESQVFHEKFQEAMKSQGHYDGALIGSSDDHCEAFRVGVARNYKKVVCRLNGGGVQGEKILLTHSNQDCMKFCENPKEAKSVTPVYGYKYTTGVTDAGQSCESYRVDFIKEARKVLCRVVVDGNDSLRIVRTNQECRAQCLTPNDTKVVKEISVPEVEIRAPAQGDAAEK